MLAAAPVFGPSAAMAAVAEGTTGKAGKVLMPIGDATEAMDTLYPFFRIAEDDFEVVVAGPEARPVPHVPARGAAES